MPNFAILLLAASVSPNIACDAGVERAYKLTWSLPDNQGRNLLLRDIARAQDARHESDPKGCEEIIVDVLMTLRQSGRR